eukprot:TRINITY_DN29_c0_g4_i1.p9 TRINITY_DN29_c0_g4~~TRINITY_DN29_c0_g4_i1.p9  ORF type:complete len:131 (+),score=0.59 TRINITY_DN29_c0_g4_i1:518-910(+)
MASLWELKMNSLMSFGIDKSSRLAIFLSGDSMKLKVARKQIYQSLRKVAQATQYHGTAIQKKPQFQNKKHVKLWIQLQKSCIIKKWTPKRAEYLGAQMVRFQRIWFQVNHIKKELPQNIVPECSLIKLFL